MSIILSPNRYVGRRAPIRLIVLHTMEVEESGSVAEAVGNAFADPARQASAHVGVDTDSSCRYVPDQDTAWAAPGANADGLQLEMAGRAGQTTGQWADRPSGLILWRAAQQAATWCRAYGIPPIRLTDAQLGAGKSRGIVDHWAVTRVFKLSNHTDVGPAFGWTGFLALVDRLIPGPINPPQTRPATAPATRIHLAVDGDFGPRTKARLQQWAGLPVDSVLTATDWPRIQYMVGSSPKYIWLGLQRITGAKQDNIPGKDTYLHLQTYLNSH
jgi:hypothetical protein